MAHGTALFNVNDGLTGRDGGPYLDREEQHEAERRRAIVEEREPDYSQKTATAGTQLVTGPQLVLQTANTNHIPSQEGVNPLGDSLQKIAEDDSTPVEVFTIAPTDEFDDNESGEQTSSESDVTADNADADNTDETYDSNDDENTSGHPNTDIFK